MKRIIPVVLSLLTLPAIADVRSTSGFYVGGSVVTTHEDADGTALEVVGGYKFSPFIGAEMRIGHHEDDLSYFSALYRVESANDVAKTYLFGGYTYNDADGDNFNTLTAGAGLGFVIFDTLNLNLEYRANINNDDDFDMRSFSVGVDYRF